MLLTDPVDLNKSGGWTNKGIWNKLGNSLGSIANDFLDTITGDGFDFVVGGKTLKVNTKNANTIQKVSKKALNTHPILSKKNTNLDCVFGDCCKKATIPFLCEEHFVTLTEFFCIYDRPMGFKFSTSEQVTDTLSRFITLYLEQVTLHNRQELVNFAQLCSADFLSRTVARNSDINSSISANLESSISIIADNAQRNTRSSTENQDNILQHLGRLGLGGGQQESEQKLLEGNQRITLHQLIVSYFKESTKHT